MDSGDDILISFIEDASEHLAGIESNLMDLEQAGANIDPELVNTIFRAAHSIKGGAGFLGLNNVQNLGHKLENILHMARNGEIVPDKRIVSALLSGFDRLRTLVMNAQESDQEDISVDLEVLSTLTRELLPEERKDQLDIRKEITFPDGRPAFEPDQLSLENALSGGKYLYLVEYDLIHDVHARGKTPLDLMGNMESTGLVVDCRTDLSSVGDLDSPMSNKIPFYVLFATIVEPDVISYLFALDSTRIHELDGAALLASTRNAAEAKALGKPEKPIKDSVREGALRMSLPEPLSFEALKDLRDELSRVLNLDVDVILDLTEAREIDTAFVQLVCSAHHSFHARGRTLCVTPAGAGPLAARLVRLGFSADSASICDFASCPLLGQEAQ